MTAPIRLRCRASPSGTPNLARVVKQTFDRDDNLRTLTDPNGTVRTCTHDAVNRLIQCSVARGPDVTGTTLQAFQYDGLSRATLSTDNNDPGTMADDSTVTCFYDSLSRKLEEHQTLDADDRILSWDWQDDDLRKALIYPNDRKVSTTWDGQDRLKTMANTSGGPVTGQLAGYEYIGNRLLKRSTVPNGILLTMANDAGNQATGYDGDRRLVEMRHKLGGNVQTAFNYTYDRMDNRLTEQRQHNAQTSESWAYDSVYRLTVQKRDIPQGGGIPGEERAWTLDGAQNWASLSISVNGGVPTVLSQTMNDMESYTLFGKVPQADDFNGNRVDDGEFLYRWDFLNRLREVYRKKSKALITTCAYDALGAQGHLNGSGRRIRKAVTNSGVQDEDVRFLWDGRTLIQEQDAVSGMLIRQHVQAGLGAPLELDRDTNGDGILDQALFRQENAMGWAEALADVSGAVLERYSYDAYGAPTFLDASGNPLPEQTRSALGNNLLWGGGYRDNLTKTVSLGHRTYSERQGRFLSRDPLGLWGDGVGWGNGYAYVGNRGVMGWDPEGLNPMAQRMLQYVPQATRATQRYGRQALAWTQKHGQQAWQWVQRDVQATQRDLSRVWQATQRHAGSAWRWASREVPSAWETTKGTISRTWEGAKGWFSPRADPCPQSTADLSKLSVNELNALIRGGQKDLLSQFFGGGMKGAAQRAAQFEVPQGLTPGSLRAYEEVARRAIEAGRDPGGVQAARLALVRKALGE